VCDTLRQTNFDPGGFSEYLRLPAINVDRGVYVLPDDMPFEIATFIEPVACVFRGQRLLNLQVGETVLIIGSGIAGLLHIQLAKITGATRIIAIDIHEYRLDAAKRFGADTVIHANDKNIPERIREINNGFLVDVVIVCTGALSAITQAFECVERCGRILLFAPTNKGVKIPVSINDIFWRNEITVMSSYAGNFRDHMKALELIASGKLQLQDMITHRLPLADTGVGFKLVSQAKESIKVIIEPHK
jgi:L-iditol 2-dehydrogenase